MFELSETYLRMHLQRQKTLQQQEQHRHMLEFVKQTQKPQGKKRLFSW